MAAKHRVSNLKAALEGRSPVLGNFSHGDGTLFVVSVPEYANPDENIVTLSRGNLAETPRDLGGGERIQQD